MEEVKRDVFSVWALPDEESEPRFRKLMEALRSEFAGPRFDPHVTVAVAANLTADEAKKMFEAACDGLKAYTATVDRVSTGTFFYQCVFLLLKSTPEVMEAGEHCKNHFQLSTTTRQPWGKEKTMTEEKATPLQPPQTQEDDEEKKGMYAVWAVPEDDVEDRLGRLMEGLRSEFGGPTFDPHLTLVGPHKLTEGEAKRMFKAACEGFKAYPAIVDQVSAGDSYFQCVYVSIRHTLEVMNAAGHFMAHFTPFTGKFYVPHMSILYGDLTEEEKKKALEKAYTLDSSLDGLNFRINRVALWIIDSDVGSWVKIYKHNLISETK